MLIGLTKAIHGPEGHPLCTGFSFIMCRPRIFPLLHNAFIMFRNHNRRLKLHFPVTTPVFQIPTSLSSGLPASQVSEKQFRHR